MTINIKTFLLCPVPDDQKPINEYLNLKENKFLNWGNLNTNKNKKFLGTIFLTFFSFFSINQFQPFSFATFFEILFNTLIIIQFFLFVILIRWITINQKFQNSRLIYEVSRKLTHHLIESLLSQTRDNIIKHKIETEADIRDLGCPLVDFTVDVVNEVKIIKEFLFKTSLNCFINFFTLSAVPCQ